MVERPFPGSLTALRKRAPKPVARHRGHLEGASTDHWAPTGTCALFLVGPWMKNGLCPESTLLGPFLVWQRQFGGDEP
jgi:hypothetical protein